VAVERRQLLDRLAAIEVREQAVSVAEAEARAFAQGSAVATNQRDEILAVKAEELRRLEADLVWMPSTISWLVCREPGNQ
jgi:hypothetical protein